MASRRGGGAWGVERSSLNGESGGQSLPVWIDAGHPRGDPKSGRRKLVGPQKPSGKRPGAQRGSKMIETSKVRDETLHVTHWWVCQMAA